MEIDLLVDYPKIRRDTKERLSGKTPERVSLAKKFGWEFFDMKGVCYDGYIYDGRWKPIVKKFIDYYKLKPNDRVLDLGCAKAYLLYDLIKEQPRLNITGIDISRYAIGCAPPEVQHFLMTADAKDLSMFSDNWFDLTICINTIHNLKEKECRQAVREIQRVSKQSYIVVDAYRTEEEKERVFDWILTAETVLSVDEWKQLFKEENYTGDYFWFIP
jgi:ubiquinone/menaquinone biosynthesis C-methylase UbiE